VKFEKSASPIVPDACEVMNTPTTGVAGATPVHGREVAADRHLGDGEPIDQVGDAHVLMLTGLGILFGLIAALVLPVQSVGAAPVVPHTATVSQTYTTSIVHHHAMEPHATVASWSNGHLTIYTATQGTPLVVSRMANALGVASGNIHVINRYVGGAFGGKWGNWAHTPLTAAAAQALNKPVKTVLTREQVFTVVGHRPMTSQTVTISASPDGTITALTHNGTASKSNASNFTENPATVSTTGYSAGKITTNKTTVDLDVPATTIMRAPSEANGSFALECAIDELAVALNMDPLALRQKNYASTVPGGTKPWSSKHLAECYTTGASAFGWSKRNKKPAQVLDGDWYAGLGMATAIYQASRSNATLKVRLQSNGTALVAGTGSDAGTGQATVFAILGAAALGIPVAQVTAQLGDSTLPTAADAGGSSSGSPFKGTAARSQIMGGVIMGIGQALLEGSVLETSGRIANANLGSYLVPVNADLPHIDVTFLNYPDTKFTPIGMRGIGELGIIGVAAAVANAVYNASGKRVRSLPITLDKLL
jgi:CO/xanthine dehydrogenase Mo-binding subunit